MIRNLIWDFDGTLFDTYTAQVALLAKILSDDYGIALGEQRIRDMTSRSLGFALGELAALAGKGVDEVKDRFIRTYSAMPLEREYPYPGAREVCTAVLRSGGVNMINTHRGSERLGLLLKMYGMEDLFADRITAENGFPRKPDPASFQALLERNGLEREETLVIGDRELDILGGRNAGMATYFFNSNRIDPIPFPSDYIGDSLEGIFCLIGKGEMN